MSVTLTHTTQETRMSMLPVVKGIIYEANGYGEGVADNGVPYTSVEAYRVKRGGERSRIASLTVYDVGQLIAWDRADSTEADLHSRNNLRDALKKDFEISPVSSLVFTI